MKHSFLLDENIFYLSIKGVDVHDQPDLTAIQLVTSIAKNCHSIRYNAFLLTRYRHHLALLKKEPSRLLQPVFFERLFFGNSAKAVQEFTDPPDLPANAQIPNEDIDVVRAALVSHPKFITSDTKLRDAINACEHLHLTAMNPSEAMVFASET